MRLSFRDCLPGSLSLGLGPVIWGLMWPELHRLCDKWFLQPIPPQGINLGMRMPYLLSDSFKYPSDYVP